MRAAEPAKTRRCAGAGGMIKEASLSPAPSQACFVQHFAAFGQVGGNLCYQDSAVSGSQEARHWGPVHNLIHVDGMNIENPQ